MRLLLPSLLRALAVLLLAGCLTESCEATGMDDAAVPNTALPENPCDEQRRSIGLDQETPFGYPAREAADRVEGMHSETLRWTNGASGRIDIEASGATATVVTSRPTPSYVPGSYARTCGDYLELTVHVSLRTADAQLDGEEADLTLRVYGASEAFGTLSFGWDSFNGSYAPPVTSHQCFERLDVKILFVEGSFHGSLNNVLSNGACDSDTDVALRTVIAAHWGTRWQSY